MRRSFTLTELLVLMTLIALLAVFLLPGSGPGRRRRALRQKCANDLRQLSLAAIQYGDDKRVFPHVGGPQALDGDITSSDTPRAMRALIYFGYHDNPEALVCHESTDLFLPIQNQAVRDDMRLWGWQGAPSPPGSPWQGSAPRLVDTDELSYGYTRRALSSNVAAGVALAADRGLRVSDSPPNGAPPGHQGNHDDGWNVVKTDARVEWVTPDAATPDGTAPGDFLRGTAAGQGALPLSSVADPAAR